MKQLGFTLVELLISLVILLIILSLGGVSYHYLSQKQRSDAIILQLYRALQLARHQAIRLHEIVTICPSKDRYNCDNSWGDGYLIFLDCNADGKVQAPNDIIKYVNTDLANGTLSWNGFRKQQYIQFTPEGFTQNQNGTFQYCAKDNNPHTTRALFVSKTGKLRWSQDTDHDGIHENSGGKALECNKY